MVLCRAAAYPRLNSYGREDNHDGVSGSMVCTLRNAEGWSSGRKWLSWAAVPSTGVVAMKKLTCALAATVALVGSSLVATSGAEARPYRYYAKPGHYGAYAYPRYGYYRGYRRNCSRCGWGIDRGCHRGLGGPGLRLSTPGLCVSGSRLRL